MISRSKSGSDFATLLDDYAATVPAAASGRGSHLGRWPLYAAATGAALASATSADASVITGNFGSLISLTQSHIGANASASTFKNLTFRTSRGAYLDILTAELVIKRLSHSGRHATLGFALLGTVSTVGGVFASGPNHSLRRFLLSQPIQSGPTMGIGGILSRAAGTHPVAHGQFASGVPGYAGFTLGNGGMGWIQLTWSSQAGNTIPDTLAFGSWAINTSGGIYAGTTVPTPEPGTFPLALLALGAPGIAAWRKRRAAAEAPSAS